MTVSVLVSAYNHERFIEQALDSVAAQTYRPLEVIVTDDCSRDRTAEVIRAWLDRTGFPARFVANERNRGICAVLNHALELATGRYVCLLDGDDVYTPDRVERHAAALDAAPAEVAAVVSDMRVIDADGGVVNPSFLDYAGHGPWRDDEPLFDQLLGGSFLPSSAVTVRRAALDAVGPFDATLSFEDYDMWLRLADRFEFSFVPGTVVDYRVLGSSLSHAPARRTVLLDDMVTILGKWTGRSPAWDRIIARHLFLVGRQALALDDRVARRAFTAARAAGLTGSRRVLAPVATLPGGVSLLRTAFTTRDRVLGRR